MVKDLRTALSLARATGTPHARWPSARARPAWDAEATPADPRRRRAITPRSCHWL